RASGGVRPHGPEVLDHERQEAVELVEDGLPAAELLGGEGALRRRRRGRGGGDVERDPETQRVRLGGERHGPERVQRGGQGARGGAQGPEQRAHLRDRGAHVEGEARQLRLAPVPHHRPEPRGHRRGLPRAGRVVELDVRVVEPEVPRLVQLGTGIDLDEPVPGHVGEAPAEERDPGPARPGAADPDPTERGGGDDGVADHERPAAVRGPPELQDAAGLLPEMPPERGSEDLVVDRQREGDLDRTGRRREQQDGAQRPEREPAGPAPPRRRRLSPSGAPRRVRPGQGAAAPPWAHRAQNTATAGRRRPPRDPARSAAVVSGSTSGLCFAASDHAGGDGGAERGGARRDRRSTRSRAREEATVSERRLHVGIGVDQNLPWATLVERWRLVEALGFDSIWDFAHLNQPSRPEGPYFEAWSVLAGLAVHTERVRIGVLVSCNTFRHPSVLAKQAITVDHMSNGRLDVGLGAGWFVPEHEAYGIDFPGPGARVARFREAVEVVDRLLSQERTTYEGAHYRLRDAICLPRPIQQPRPPLM